MRCCGRRLQLSSDVWDKSALTDRPLACLLPLPQYWSELYAHQQAQLDAQQAQQELEAQHAQQAVGAQQAQR